MIAYGVDAAQDSTRRLREGGAGIFHASRVVAEAAFARIAALIALGLAAAQATFQRLRANRLGRDHSRHFFAGASFAAIAALIALSVAAAQETFQGAPSAKTAQMIGIPGPAPEQALNIEGWLVYPSMFLGYVFTDNVYGRPDRRVAASGVRLRPAFEALRDNGLHKTMVYLDADLQAYPGLGVGERFSPFFKIYDAPPTNLAARAGVNHVWEPTPDLTIRFAFDFARQSGLFSPSFGANATQAFLTGAATFASVQQYTNQVSGAVSVEKKITDRTFVRAAAVGQYISYDSQPAVQPILGGVLRPSSAGFGGQGAGQAFSNFQNGFAYRGLLRGGAWITPQIYGYVEPAIDLRRYNNSIFDSNGYRVVGGLGSDMISLFRGEIYGGYQVQHSANGLFGRTAAPAFGARVFYFPTRDVTLSIGVDQTLSSTVPQLRNGVAGGFGFGGFGGFGAFGVFSPFGFARNGVASITRQVMAQGDWLVTPDLTIAARGGYGETRFSGVPLANSAWSGGVTASYNVWRNVSLTVDYQFLKTSLKTDSITRLTTGFASGYTKNVVSVGLNYRF